MPLVFRRNRYLWSPLLSRRPTLLLLQFVLAGHQKLGGTDGEGCSSTPSNPHAPLIRDRQPRGASGSGRARAHFDGVLMLATLDRDRRRGCRALCGNQRTRGSASPGRGDPGGGAEAPREGSHQRGRPMQRDNRECVVAPRARGTLSARDARTQVSPRARRQRSHARMLTIRRTDAA